MPYIDSDSHWFYLDKTIADCDVDQHNVLKIAALQQHMQDTSTHHLLHEGVSYFSMKEKGQVYLLIWSRLRLFRVVKVHEVIRIFTAIAGNKGARAYRNYWAVDEKGERIMECNTAWVLLDPVKRQILNPNHSLLEIATGADPGLSIPDAKKVVLKETPPLIHERLVHYSDMDFNGHMNNTIYSEYFLDACPVDLSAYRVQDYLIHFAQEAFLHDTMAMHAKAEDMEDGAKKVWMTGEVGGKRSFEIEALLVRK